MQGRKAVNIGCVITPAITAGRQSRLLRGALENSVRHIPQNASPEGERVRELGHSHIFRSTC